jgi:glutathione synthase
VRVAFFVNRIEDEVPEYTTTRLAEAAVRLGHETYYLDADSFIYAGDESLDANARRVEKKKSYEALIEAVQEADDVRISIDDLDALVLRNETEIEVEQRPWATMLGISFGQLATERGVTVVNHPIGLAKAFSKLYLQLFPAEVRPRTLVSRDETEIKKFIDSEGGSAVLKPLKGARGESVFLVRPDDDANVNQMIEAVLRSGYAIAQEYLEAAENGDVRALLVDGELLEVDGKYAAFRRIPGDDDMRSNMSAGGGAAEAEVDDTLLGIVKTIGPRLRGDGMFLVGIDVVGDKVLEINVESAGGLGSAGILGGVDFNGAVIEALADKVDSAKSK